MNLTTKTDTPETYFSRELLAWYRASKRTLPWRRDRDAYRIWVSEIMLQQTRVDTVIPYYERFMARFPTLQALAEAPEADVLKHWEGLGYYSRARNLQAGAREVAERYGGRVPDDKAAVSALKGVGPYTAGAIMSIAFNRPEPAVDGNVMRVLSRYFNRDEDIAKPSTRIGMEKLAASLIPDGAAGDFNQALMELGALVCTPRTPGCLTCPVMALCAGRIAGRETELPVKAKAKPPKPQLLSPPSSRASESMPARCSSGSGRTAGCSPACGSCRMCCWTSLRPSRAAARRSWPPRRSRRWSGRPRMRPSCCAGWRRRPGCARSPAAGSGRRSIRSAICTG